MDSAISEYQKWKQQGHSLRTQAKQAMEARFRDLLTEAAQVAHEYQNDFGVALKPPPSITTFRFKSATGKPASKTKKATAPVPKPEKAPEKAVNPKIAPLREAPGAGPRKTGDGKNRRQADPESRRQDLRDRRRHSPGRAGGLIAGG